MRLFLFTLSALLWISQVKAQTTTKPAPVRFSAEMGGLVSSGRQTPFWLRANQFGAMPNVGPAGIVRLGLTGTVSSDSTGKKWFAGYGVETVGILSPNNRLVVPEAYAKGGRGYLEIVIGRRKEVLGLVDTTLSSGSYSWSGNALPIPKIQLGTRGFAPLPFTNDLLAINAFFAHGWFAGTDSMQNSFLHQKAVYGRIGKPGWKVKFYGGILHHAQWGGRSNYLGNGASRNGELPSSFNDYLHIIVAKQPKQTGDFSNHDIINQFGNHIGSMDIGAEWATRKWDVLTYYQHPFEDKSGVAMVNFPDGLYGVRVKRRALESHPFFQVNQILVEYLTTRSQSGSSTEIGSRLYEGLDDYFNNFQYLDGWTHRRQVIGTSFMSHRNTVRQQWRDLANRPWPIINNRVQLLHIGVMSTIRSTILVQSRLSLSNNYGLFREPFGEKVTQFSGDISLVWPTEWLNGCDVKAVVAVDQGGLFNNTAALMISIRKVYK